MRRLAPIVLAALAASGCSSSSSTDSSASGAGSISGSPHGSDWTKLSRAYWIGKPAQGSVPVILFLFEAPVECQALTVPNWDKTVLGDSQLLEIDLKEAAAKTYTVQNDVAIAYLKGEYNPSAETGTLTVDAVTPGQSLRGSFSINLADDGSQGSQAKSSLKGTFDAKYCAEGIEP